MTRAAPVLGLAALAVVAACDAFSADTTPAVDAGGPEAAANGSDSGHDPGATEAGRPNEAGANEGGGRGDNPVVPNLVQSAPFVQNASGLTIAFAAPAKSDSMLVIALATAGGTAGSLARMSSDNSGVWQACDHPAGSDTPDLFLCIATLGVGGSQSYELKWSSTPPTTVTGLIMEWKATDAGKPPNGDRQTASPIATLGIQANFLETPAKKLVLGFAAVDVKGLGGSTPGPPAGGFTELHAPVLGGAVELLSVYTNVIDSATYRASWPVQKAVSAATLINAYNAP